MGSTYYVRTDGSDTNTGLGPGTGQAFQTIFKALYAAINNGQSGNKIWIAPGYYPEYIETLGEEFIDNLTIEGNSDGTVFYVPPGPIDGIEMLRIFYGSSTSNALTIKNIMIDYSLVVHSWYQGLCDLTLINVLLKEGAFELNAEQTSIVTVTAINCTTVSTSGNLNVGDGATLYNCAISGDISVGLANIYNCMSYGVYYSEGSVVENYINQYPQFVNPYYEIFDYHLLEGDPGIDSGVVVEGYSPDIYGAVRTGIPDRGAAEISSGAAFTSDPPVIVGPNPILCAKPLVVLQAPSPIETTWMLHFKIESFADAGGTQLIAAVDSSTNPELFEYSTDGGLTWAAFPVAGLPPEAYGAYVRARVEVGPRKEVYIRASVGAEPV